MFFYAWYPALMLAVESNNVIDIRLWKIATGGLNAGEETRLMISEKVDAAVAAGSMLMSGQKFGGNNRLLSPTRCSECGTIVELA